MGYKVEWMKNQGYALELCYARCKGLKWSNLDRLKLVLRLRQRANDESSRQSYEHIKCGVKLNRLHFLFDRLD